MGIYKEKHLDIFIKAGYITENEKKEIMEGKKWLIKFNLDVD